MILRDATLADAAAISELVSAEMRVHIGPLLQESGLQTLLANASIVSTRQRIRDGWLHIVAVDHHDLLAGIIVVRPPSHLYHVFVRSDLHRTGVATKLFTKAEVRVKESCGTGLTTVNSSPNSIAVYERFGFVPNGALQELDGVWFQPMIRPDAE